MDTVEFIIYLGGDWTTYHRRPMIEALARNAEQAVRIICVNPPVVPTAHWLVHRRRLFRWLANPEPQRLAPNLFLFTPHLWWHDRLLSLLGRRERNRAALARQLSSVRRRIGGDAAVTVSWLYRPDQCELTGLAHEDFVVYECLDDFQRRVSDGEFLPPAAEQEQRLLKRADLVLASSQVLYESRAGQHSAVHYFPNGVDYELFSTPREQVPEQLRDLPRPIVGYTGNLTLFLDGDLMMRIARSHPDWSLVLVGPHDPRLDLDELFSLPNVHRVGRRPHWELPRFTQSFDVAILPLQINDYLEKCNPLSLYEHLAAGTPVVISDVPAARRLADAAYVARTHDDFLKQLRSAVEHRSQDRIDRGREIAAEHSWQDITHAELDTILDAAQAKLCHHAADVAPLPAGAAT